MTIVYHIYKAMKLIEGIRQNEKFLHEEIQWLMRW